MTDETRVALLTAARELREATDIPVPRAFGLGTKIATLAGAVEWWALRDMGIATTLKRPQILDGECQDGAVSEEGAVINLLDREFVAIRHDRKALEEELKRMNLCMEIIDRALLLLGEDEDGEPEDAAAQPPE